MINLRDQTFGVVADDSSTIDIGAGDTLYIQGGTNVTTSTNSDGSITINSTASGGGGSLSAANGVDNRIPTFTSSDALTGESGLTFDGTNLLVTGNARATGTLDGGNFRLSANGLHSRSGLNTLRISAQEYASNTENDANVVELFAKHIEYHNTNSYHSIKKGGDLVFRGNLSDTAGVADSGGFFPQIALREYEDAGNIEITPKPGQPVEIDGVDIKDNTISSNASNANLEISANGTGKVEISGIKYPTSDGSANQVLKTDGSGNLSFANQTGGLADIVSDTSPQLGGDLDMNGQDIVTTSNANIELAPNGTGKTVLKGNTNPGTLIFNCENNSHGQTVKAQPHSASVTNVLTLPAGGDQEIVGTSATQTLTNKSGNISMFTNDSGYITDSTLTVVGDDSTGTTFSAKNGDDLKVVGANGITAAVSGNTLTIDAASVSGTGAANAFKTITVAGQDNVVADNAADTLTLVAGSNMTLTTSASGDSVTFASSGGASGVTVQDEGSSLSTSGTTLNFVGDGVVASGTGATKTITIAGGGGSTGDFTFSGNKMSTSSSNADVEIEANADGGIRLRANGQPPDYYSSYYSGQSSVASRSPNITTIENYIGDWTNGNRLYAYNTLAVKLTGSDSSSSSSRFRKQDSVMCDYNGLDSTNTGGSRGVAHSMDVVTTNSNSHGVNVGNHGGFRLWSAVGDNENGDLFTGDITLTNQTGANLTTAQTTASGQTVAVSDVKTLRVGNSAYGGGTETITNYTALHAQTGNFDVTSDFKLGYFDSYSVNAANIYAVYANAGGTASGQKLDVFAPTDTNKSKFNDLEIGDSGSGTEKIIKSTVSNDSLKISTQGTGDIVIEPGTDTSHNSANDIASTVFADRLRHREAFYDDGSHSGTHTPDINNGNVQMITLNGDITISSISNIDRGQSLTLILVQDGTGGRSLTSTMKFAGGAKTLTPSANAIDVMSIFYTGSTYIASLSTNFS